MRYAGATRAVSSRSDLHIRHCTNLQSNTPHHTAPITKRTQLLLCALEALCCRHQPLLRALQLPLQRSAALPQLRPAASLKLKPVVYKRQLLLQGCDCAGIMLLC